MKVSFGVDLLIYATDPRADDKRPRALDLLRRAMYTRSGVLLLQTLVEFCARADEERVPVRDVQSIIEAWRAVMPVQAPTDEDFVTALANWTSQQRFSDALLWASARRAGVTHILTGEAADGLDIQGVVSVDPFVRGNNHLVDRILADP